MSLKRTSGASTRPETLQLDDRIVPAAVPVTTHLFAVGSDPGNAAQVHVYDANGSLKYDFLAYSQPNFRGGVRVATADVNGDGTDDIITTPGPGMRSLVQVFDGVSGQRII